MATAVGVYALFDMVNHIFMHIVIKINGFFGQDRNHVPAFVKRMLTINVCIPYPKRQSV